MTALATSETTGEDAFADGAPVLVGGPGDPVVYVTASAARIDGPGLQRVSELAGSEPLLGVCSDHAVRLGLARGAPIDAAAGVDVGWSPRGRAHTMRVAAAPGAVAADLVRPGHVVPVLIDPAATPAAVAALELTRFAGRTTAVVIAPVCDATGVPVDLAAARDRLDLPHLQSTPLRARAILAAAGGRLVECTLPTPAGTFRAVALDGGGDDPVCLGLVHGDLDATDDPLVRVHVACPAGDVLRATTCGCRAALERSERDVVAAGAGAIAYVRPRGVVWPACARGTAVDPAPVLALLAACGVSDVRLRHLIGPSLGRPTG